MTKANEILRLYPTDPTKDKSKNLNYSTLARKFDVSRQFVWSLYHPIKKRPDMKLTPKQKGFAKTYLKTGNKRQAVLENYDTKSIKTADTIAQINSKNPIVQQYMIQILDKADLDDTRIAGYLKDIIHEGVESGTSEARDAVKAIELVMKLRDRFPSTKIEQTQHITNIDVDNATVGELLNKLHKITDENKKFLGAIRGEVVESQVGDQEVSPVQQ